MSEPLPPLAPALLPDSAADYLRAVAIEHHASSNTLAAYRINLLQFFGWLKSSDALLVTPALIRQYTAYLKTFLSGRSIRQKLATLHGFFLHLAKFNRDFSPPSMPKVVKILLPTIQTLSIEQIHSLLSAASSYYQSLLEQPDSPCILKYRACALRDIVAILLMIGTGIRVGELTGIRISDIDLKNHSVLIHGKGGYTRFVFFDIPELADIFNTYLDWRKKQAFDHDFLLFNSKNWGRITTRSIQRMLKRYLLLSNLSNSLTPHGLRHSYATICLENGANIKAIAQLLGHRHVSTTLTHYAHISQTALRLINQCFNPLARQSSSIREAVDLRRQFAFPSFNLRPPAAFPLALS